MDMNAALGVLRETALFRETDLQRLKVVAMVGDRLRYRAGETIFRRGDDGDAAYVVLAGAVDVVMPTPAGETAIARLGRGELFGEIAVLCDRPRISGIVAAEETEVLRLERDTLTGLMADLPGLSLRMIRMLAGRLETTTLALADARAARG
jgi:CRP-like cAMP-binding protein